jgi:hypothetical protein
MKILLGVVALIGLAMAAGAYFLFNPVLLIFVILGVGFFRLCRTETPKMPLEADGHWGVGDGIYFDRDDVWVQGSGRRTTYDVNDGAPRQRDGHDKGER